MPKCKRRVKREAGSEAAHWREVNPLVRRLFPASGVCVCVCAARVSIRVFTSCDNFAAKCVAEGGTDEAWRLGL